MLAQDQRLLPGMMYTDRAEILFDPKAPKQPREPDTLLGASDKFHAPQHADAVHQAIPIPRTSER